MVKLASDSCYSIFVSLNLVLCALYFESSLHETKYKEPSTKFIEISDHKSQVSEKFSGDFVGRVTPVPIPNTEVKPAGADDTAPFRCGKVRSRRIYFNEKPVHL